MVEPWISGSHSEVDALLRPLLHAIEHARMDIEKWTAGFSVEQLWAQPLGLGAVGFHIRHIARSTDRLFSYAEGRPLSEFQMAALHEETVPGASREDLLSELNDVFDHVAARVRALDPASLCEPRSVGRKMLPTTLAGLLVHIAEHTMRHVGETIVTAKVVKATAERGTQKRMLSY